MKNLIIAGISCLATLGSAVDSVSRFSKRDLAQQPLLYKPSKSTKEANLSIPIDHFHNSTLYEPHSNGTFPNRYFYDTTYYKPGGPVICLFGGELSVADRVPYLEKGIVHQLAKETNGVGVVFEHRYYGTSQPFDSWTVENLRFLRTEQALQDADYFARNVHFDGLPHGIHSSDLHAPNTPWIIYGGSYAGGMVSLARKIYPETFWGAISSSGVTVAINDFWQYHIAQYESAPKAYITAMQDLVDTFDALLMDKDEDTFEDFLSVMGLDGWNATRKDVADVAIARHLGSWQARNWDPQVDDPSWSEWAANFTSPSEVYSSAISPATRAKALSLLEKAAPFVKSEFNGSTISKTAWLNFLGHTNASVAMPCRSQNKTINECFADEEENNTAQQGVSIRQWFYQVCTEWGYFQRSHAMANGRPLESRFITYESFLDGCRQAYNITTPPDNSRINKFGGFNLTYPRLAQMGGSADPWIAATPLHVFDGGVDGWKNVVEPRHVIQGGVHRWDENYVLEDEFRDGEDEFPPNEVRAALAVEKFWVKEWLGMWRRECLGEKKNCTGV